MNKKIIKNTILNINVFILFFYFIIALSISLIEIILPLFEGKMIDSLWNGDLNKKLFFILVLGCIILNGFLYFLLYYVFFKLKSNVAKNISLSVLNRIVYFNRKNIQKKGVGSYVEFLSREPEQFAECVDPSSMFFVLSIVISFVAVIISLRWSYAFLIIFPPIIVLYLLVDRLLQTKLTKTMAKIEDISYEIEPKAINYIENAKVISKFGNTKHYLDALNSMENESLNIKNKFIILKELRTGFSDIISAFTFIAFLCIACFDIYAGRITFSGFVILLSYYGLILLPISYHGAYKMILNNAEYGQDLLDNIYEECNVELNKKVNLLMNKDESLYVENLCFSYSKNNIEDNNIGENNMNDGYKNISFKIENGESLGVVGISGEGKSTIVKLILGELNPTSGEVKINGVDVKTMPQAILDYVLCVYEQTSKIVEGDLYENICLGRNLLSDTEYEEQLSSITKQFEEDLNNKKVPSQIADLFGFNHKYSLNKQLSAEETNFIQNLLSEKVSPQLLAKLYCSKINVKKSKVDSIISSLKIENLHGRNLGENGKGISGGEKERISMARFLTKDNASIYIIDEPFTSLDAKTENECLEILASHMKNKNLFVVSHKFNVLKALTKKCIVLKNGVIIEAGTHEELKNNHGLYSELLDFFTSHHENKN